MRWFRKTPPTADISILRVELMKAQMHINELQYRVTELKENNDILQDRIIRFLGEIEIESDEVWDAIEILLGDR